MKLALGTLTLVCALSGELTILAKQNTSNESIEPLRISLTNYTSLRHYNNYKRNMTPIFEKRSEGHKKKNASIRKMLSDEKANSTNGGEEGKPKNKSGSKNKLFRIHGKGKAEVPMGGTVVVPNSMNRKTIYKNSNGEKENDKKEQSAKAKDQRGLCKTECPPDNVVFALKGNDFVILPPLCPSNRWKHISGPQPGTMISEGLHTITGTIGKKNKMCKTLYQVLVRRCEPLKAALEDTTIRCSKNHVWGSKCTVSCGDNKEMIGSNELECMEDLTWSHTMPKCRRTTDCTVPKIKSKSNIWCRTSNLTTINHQEDFIPDGSTCKFLRRGLSVTITCRSGVWKGIRKKKVGYPRKRI